MVNLDRMTEAPFLSTFTGLSNILVGLVALICLFVRLRMKSRRLPRWLFVTKLVSVAEIMVTFLITAAYLAPSVGAQWWRLYVNASLFNHFLTPVLAIAGFLVWEEKGTLRYPCCFFTSIPMGAYATFYAFNCYTHVDASGQVDLRYDIYGLTRWGPWMLALLALGFLALSIGMATALFLLNKRKSR